MRINVYHSQLIGNALVESLNQDLYTPIRHSNHPFPPKITAQVLYNGTLTLYSAQMPLDQLKYWFLVNQNASVIISSPPPHVCSSANLYPLLGMSTTVFGPNVPLISHKQYPSCQSKNLLVGLDRSKALMVKFSSGQPLDYSVQVMYTSGQHQLAKILFFGHKCPCGLSKYSIVSQNVPLVSLLGTIALVS